MTGETYLDFSGETIEFDSIDFLTPLIFPDARIPGLRMEHQPFLAWHRGRVFRG
jgi:hypothetical protein